MEPKQDLLKNPHLAFEILVFLEPNFRKNLFDMWVHGDSSVDQEVGFDILKNKFNISTFENVKYTKIILQLQTSK